MVRGRLGDLVAVEKVILKRIKKIVDEEWSRLNWLRMRSRGGIF
jgi:hypothetical protein